MAKAFADKITASRVIVYSQVDPIREFVEGLTLPADFRVGDGIAELRTVLQLILLQERLLAVYLLFFAVALAISGGLLVGDRIRPNETVIEFLDDATFRDKLPPSEAAAYDAGVEASPRRLSDEERAAQSSLAEPQRRVRHQKDVSLGLWIELCVCIALDALGDASLFYPVGEVADFAFAFVAALFIELFFDWPALALFALWEELLPFTDLIPTATLGWALVVAFGLRPTKRDRASLLRGPVDTTILAPGARPPPADRRSYQPAESYLQEGSRPWED